MLVDRMEYVTKDNLEPKVSFRRNDLRVGFM